MNTQPKDTAAERAAFIQSLGFEYSASFVPFSQSRNAHEKTPSLNWRVTIKRGNQSLTTDYMQGCAHIPNYKQSREAWYTAYIAKVCELGRYMQRVSYESVDSVFGTIHYREPVPVPRLEDVLYSLVMDSDVLDYPVFEDWADSYGYDKDSRKGEQIYRACLEIGLKLRALIGNDSLERLRDLYQDY